MNEGKKNVKNLKSNLKTNTQTVSQRQSICDDKRCGCKLLDKIKNQIENFIFVFVV